MLIAVCMESVLTHRKIVINFSALVANANDVSALNTVLACSLFILSSADRRTSKAVCRYLMVLFKLHKSQASIFLKIQSNLSHFIPELYAKIASCISGEIPRSLVSNLAEVLQAAFAAFPRLSRGLFPSALQSVSNGAVSESECEWFAKQLLRCVAVDVCRYLRC